MKIDRVEVYLVSTPVRDPIADATRKVETLGMAVVCLKTDDGLTGIGLTYHEVGGEAIRQLILKDLAGQIIGKDPFATEVV